MPKRKTPPPTSPSVSTAGAPPFTLEFYEEADGKAVVLNWLRSLSLRKKQVIGNAMNEILQHLGLDVCETEFGKQLGRGLFEFRVRQDEDSVRPGVPPEKILLRVFCHAYGDKVIVLVGGYDKGEDPSVKRQQKEIDVARKRLADWKRRQKRTE